jgi:hypothetical protein
LIIAVVFVIVFSAGLLVGFQIRDNRGVEANPGIWADLCIYKADFIPQYSSLRNFYVITAVVANSDGQWLSDSWARKAIGEYDCQRAYW